MPPRRRVHRECCCETHRYLCPVHQNQEEEVDRVSLLCRILDLVNDHFKAIAFFLYVLLIGLIFFSFYKVYTNQQEKLLIQIEELKQMVEKQKENPPDDNLIKNIVKKEIEAYDADKIAQVDFALESAGGRIISILTTKPYVSDQTIFIKSLNVMKAIFCKDANAETARPILQPKMSPGECWAFEGTHGVVIMKLLATIHIRGITIEHIPATISPSAGITSAPKIFNLWGLKCREDSNAFLFGEFTYRNDSTPIQYFRVQHESKTPYNMVLLKILSNWGNQHYTCVYRVRIHGDLYQE